MSPISIGVLGCANIAKRSVIPAIQSIEQFKLKSIASRNIDKASDFAKIFNCQAFGSYQELINSDVQAIYIPLPTGLHHEWVKKALESGKHVISEKSLANNFTEATQLVELAKANNLVLMENFMFEYHSQHKYIKNLVDSGEIGEIRCFRSSFGFPPFPDADNIRYQKELGGGALLDAGGYPTKAAQLYLDGELTVRASNLAYDSQKDVDIWGGAYISSSNGTFAEIAFGFDHYYQCNIEIWGSKGKIIAERAFTAGATFEPTVIIEKQGDKQTIQLPSDNHFVNIFEEFARRINENDFSDKNYSELLTQAKLLQQIRDYDSNRN